MILHKLKIDTNALSGLIDVSRQIKFASMVALNRTANIGAQEVKLEMARVFDRPTRYVMNGVRVEPAKMKGVGTQSKYGKMRYAGGDVLKAEVFFKDERFKQSAVAAEMMAPHVDWGFRLHKPFERLLISRGIMSDKEYAIPTSEVKLDSYGNPSRGQITQMLSYFQALPESGYVMNRNRARDAKLKKPRAKNPFWVGWVNNKKYRAIYTKKGDNAVPIWIFITTRPKYSLILPFYKITEDAFNRYHEQQYDIAFKEAMATAKRY
jgi:hypothetical protein